jgi:hypothetical protein
MSETNHISRNYHIASGIRSFRTREIEMTKLVRRITSRGPDGTDLGSLTLCAQVQGLISAAKARDNNMIIPSDQSSLQFYEELA